MPAVSAPFTPAWWLPGPHTQTLWASLIRRRIPVAVEPERLELPDGDFLELAWSGPADAPALVVLLHGLEGSIRSRYASGLIDALTRRGYRTVLMHFRGCGGTPNRLPRSYHSGDTGDLAHVLEVLAKRRPPRALAAVGVSLGGNVLLKYLGEQGTAARLTAAVAVSVPFDLDDAARRLERGFSRVYQWRLLRSLRAGTRAKAARVAGTVDVAGLERLRTFRAFDDAVTAPLHGFRDAADYYRRSSSRAFLAGIRRPTLILHARDDPFMTPAALPEPGELAEDVRLELSARGGHVGFVAGAAPWRARYWLEARIPDFLAGHLEQAAPDAPEPGSLTAGGRTLQALE